MFETSKDWELFGYDMRNVGRHFVAAWRDALWADDSPLRRRLDEAVRLSGDDGEATYQAGEPSALPTARCRAVLIPDELVLARTLKLPLAVEAELDAAIAMEVSANSPFGSADTASGWRILARDEQHLRVLLVIVSRSAVMSWMGQQHHSHDPSAQEAWARVDGALVVVTGFGEGHREGLYRKRLVRVAAMVGIVLALLLVLLATGAGFKKLELAQLEEDAAVIQRESADATRMRNALVQSNETVAAVAAISSAYPSAWHQLARLTQLLGDGAYVERLSVSGRDIDLRGRASDAAAIMQLLTEQEDYREVSAASPIRTIPGTSMEQFHLKIRIGEGT